MSNVAKGPATMAVSVSFWAALSDCAKLIEINVDGTNSIRQSEQVFLILVSIMWPSQPVHIGLETALMVQDMSP